jgi:hypothetical protein
MGVTERALDTNPFGEYATRVTIPPELAWRLFPKGIDRDSARAQIEIEGDSYLEEEVLHPTAIVG